MEVSRPAEHVDALIGQALRALTQIPAIGRAGFALSEGAGRRLLFTASDRQGPALDWCHIDAFDDVPLTAAVRARQPVGGTLSELADRFPAFVARQEDTATTAVLATPLVHDGVSLGGVVVFVHGEVSLPGLRGAVAQIATTTAAALGAHRPDDTPPDDTPPDDTRGSRGSDVGPAGHSPAFTISKAQDVSAARRHLRGLLAGRTVDPDIIEDAVLCLSELLANAVMHAGTRAEVHVHAAEETVRVTVRDHGRHSGHEPQPVRDAEPTAVHGRGLRILDALSTRWGSDWTDTGASVWFELAVQPQRAALDGRLGAGASG